MAVLGAEALGQELGKTIEMVGGMGKGPKDASIDLSVGHLFRVRTPPDLQQGRPRMQGRLMSQEDFIDAHLEEVSIGSGIDISPESGPLYVLPTERIAREPGKRMRIFTRSRFARDGVGVRSLEWFKQRLDDPGRVYDEAQPLCELRSLTRFRLYPGAPLMQLFTFTKAYGRVPLAEMQDLVRSGRMGVEARWKRGHVPMGVDDLTWRKGGGLILHMYQEVIPYNVRSSASGSLTRPLIDPQDELSRIKAFGQARRINRRGSGRRKHTMDRDSFALALTDERIQRPNGYMMCITGNNADPLYKSMGLRGGKQMPGWSHAYAPMVMRDGGIVLELWNNRPPSRPVSLYHHMPITEFFLIPIEGDVGEDPGSRFHHQTRPRLGDGSGKR